MNISEISTILKREYPFLLLDGVTQIESNIICCAYKNLSYNEWFFPVHFLNQPVMPGTLQLESYTQVVALPLLIEKEINSSIPIILVGIDKVRFYKSVIPGDKFEICATIESINRGIAIAVAVGSVNNETVSECKVTYKLVEGNN